MFRRLTAVSRSQAARRDAAVFASFYEHHHRALYRYCRSILRDDEEARDALQSAMTKALAALRSEERDFELRPWLFRIAHNESISRLRRRRDLVELDAAIAVGADSLAQAVEVRERLALLASDLRNMPERQRSALVLRELCGLGHEEIAAVIGSSPRSVKQTIFEARVALQECDEGREMACAIVQRALSDGDRRVLRGRRMRAHVRSCRSCRQFKAALAQRPADFAALVPELPIAAGGAGLLAHLVAAFEVGSGPGALATKAAVVVATTAVVAGTTTAVVEKAHERHSAAAVAVGPPARTPQIGAAVVAHTIRIAAPKPRAHARHASARRASRHASRPARAKRAAKPAAARQPAAVQHAASTAATTEVAAAPSSTPSSHAAASKPAKAEKGMKAVKAAKAAPATTPAGSHPAHPVHPVQPAHPVHAVHPDHPANSAKQQPAPAAAVADAAPPAEAAPAELAAPPAAAAKQDKPDKAKAK